ncbi:helix-turn-helix transcriptional regulator [Thalassospira sp. SM2505]|uniref:AraC family transcriptional regulator n=1 Tax=Thalassospira profundimaris TaxID=502049 RepID=A0A367X516_9PROT|nr:helix-turn-helix transcriptional regulator [Thalassospira profundimaris]RCK48766.1 AraC family transcriptional regulator [Thalassospira profundimaris]
MQEFVSFGLHVALIRQLAWLPRGYDLVPAGTVVTSAKLRSIMLALEEVNGPAVLVRLGRHLAAKEQEPVLTMLRHSATPAVIADRWRRLEGYSHARARSEFSIAGKSMNIHRGVVRGQPPARVENLLLQGFLIGLLEAVGAENIDATILPSHGPAIRVMRKGRMNNKLEFTGRGLRFRINWTSFEPVSSSYPFMANMPGTAPSLGAQRPIVRQLCAILEQDVGRSWTIDEVAAALDTSGRTLQRRLQQANNRFSDVLRMVRVREACRLLYGTSLSVGEIGFWCGFTDNAHFSRDFRRLLAMPPSVYREASIGHAGLTRA